MTRLLLIAALALLTACGQPMTRADRYQKCASQDLLTSTYPFGKLVCTKRMPA